MEKVMESLRNYLNLPFISWDVTTIKEGSDHSSDYSTPVIVGALQDHLTVRLPLQSSIGKPSQDFGVGLPPLAQRN